MNIADRILELLSGFTGISLEEVQKASLMRRKDSKYVFHIADLPGLLEAALPQYRVLDIGGIRAQNYQTMYYDTPHLDMYYMHHRGRVNRHKIRFRRYGNSQEMFLEVKKKDSRGLTVKNRMQTRHTDASILSREEEFLSLYTPYAEGEMIPVLENTFNRITLVNEEQTERITLDYQLWFASRISEVSLEVPGVSIAEIKYANHLSGSPFHAALRKAGIADRRFSKYCIGMAMLDPELKQNLFKEKVRFVHKTNNYYLSSLKNQTHA